jgi:PAS domain S-box-containing protein
MQSIQILEQAFYSLEDGIGILDANSNCAFINKAAQDIFQKQINKIPQQGDAFLNFIHPERRVLYQQFITDAFNNHATTFVLNYEQDGVDTWFELSYTPVVEENGSINYVCVKAKNITEKKRLESEKAALQQRIIKDTVAAQEKERSLIGRELHDNVNQVLTTVKLYNEICYYDDKPNKELLHKSLVQVNYCIQEIRDLSRRLAVPKVDSSSFGDLIKDLIDSINDTKKTSIQLLTHGIKNLEITQELQTTIYRIVQEQITNIIKYACAGEVKVIIAGSGSDIAVQVQDNGIGFDINEKKNSNGLINMKNRAEMVGGTIAFDTAPGQGCTMTAEFPL